MPRATVTAAAAVSGLAALAIAIACGEVPTAPRGIAYITPILAPSPSVAFGDTLRDSLGRAAPLRVFAIGRDSADTIRDVTVRYLFTSVDTGRGFSASIDERGYLVADSVLRSLRIVGQVTDGTVNSSLRLQTSELEIAIVPRADSIARSGSPEVGGRLPLAVPLAVTVTGVGPAGRGAVSGIRVRFRIVETFPALPLAGRYYLADEAGHVLRPDSTIAIDTTNTGGIASRTFIGVSAAGGDADSVVVQAVAASHRNEPLRGSPVRITVKLPR